jgi:hypothetical protein
VSEFWELASRIYKLLKEIYPDIDDLSAEMKADELIDEIAIICEEV